MSCRELWSFFSKLTVIFLIFWFPREGTWQQRNRSCMINSRMEDGLSNPTFSMGSWSMWMDTPVRESCCGKCQAVKYGCKQCWSLYDMIISIYWICAYLLFKKRLKMKWLGTLIWIPSCLSNTRSKCIMHFLCLNFNIFVINSLHQTLYLSLKWSLNL